MYVVVYDFGTSSVKTCLFDIDSEIRLVASSTADYSLYITADSAFATFLYDTRKGKEGWNKGLLKMYKVNPRHMPDLIDSTDLVGGLTEQAANDLGLVKGIPVFGGGGDTTFVNIGAGCTRPGDTHIYVGTSGWVSTYLDYQTVDINAMITGVLSARFLREPTV